jgi:hypothetical protein
MTPRTILVLVVGASFCACGGPESFHAAAGLHGAGDGGLTVGAAGSDGAAGSAAGGDGGIGGAIDSAGTAGSTTDAGVNGLAGATGTAGMTGVAGSTGTAGAVGAAGATGGAGKTGAAGSNGAAGKAGSAGTTGAAGATGVAGSTGAAGSSGAAGMAGAGGATGAAGASGAAGVSGPTIKINAGTTAVVPPFVADMDFTNGGLNAPTTSAIDLSAVTNPAPEAVYQTARIGGFTYTIPGYAPGSSHTVRLHFCETYFPPAGQTVGTGQRVCNISLNGTLVLSAYDIFAKAGGKNKAVIEQFTAPADTNGDYVIQFAAVTDQCLVSGLEVQ